MDAPTGIWQTMMACKWSSTKPGQYKRDEPFTVHAAAAVGDPVSSFVFYTGKA